MSVGMQVKNRTGFPARHADLDGPGDPLYLLVRCSPIIACVHRSHAAVPGKMGR